MFAAASKFHHMEGPVALRIDRQIYEELKQIHTNRLHSFKIPVEDDGNEDLNQRKYVVQLLRITDEYLNALKNLGFDISRILSPERLQQFDLNRDKTGSRFTTSIS